LACSAADIEQDYVQSVLVDLSDAEPTDIAKDFQNLEARATNDLVEEGFEQQKIEFLREVDARYGGQGFEIRFPVEDPYTSKVAEIIRNDFHAGHRRRYGHAAENETVVIVSYRVRAIVRTDKVSATASRRNR